MSVVKKTSSCWQYPVALALFWSHVNNYACDLTSVDYSTFHCGCVCNLLDLTSNISGVLTSVLESHYVYGNVTFECLWLEHVSWCVCTLGLSSTLPSTMSDPSNCPPLPRTRSINDHDYDNRISVIPRPGKVLVPELIGALQTFFFFLIRWNVTMYNIWNMYTLFFKRRCFQEFDEGLGLFNCLSFTYLYCQVQYWKGNNS